MSKSKYMVVRSKAPLKKEGSKRAQSKDIVADLDSRVASVKAFMRMDTHVDEIK